MRRGQESNCPIRQETPPRDGFIQTAFAASQILGIPIGIYLSNEWNWHVPFLALAALGALAGLLIAWRMKPVADHLKAPQTHGAFDHLRHTVTEPRYLLSFVLLWRIQRGIAIPRP